MKKDTWVVVADSSRATILSCDRRLRSSETIEALVHAQSRLKAGDLVTSDRGRTRGGRPGRGAVSAMETPTSLDEQEADKFAHEVAQAIRDGQVHNRWESLILVAPPKFLGQLRAVLNQDAATQISETIAKNYTHEKPEDVLSRVRDALDMV